MPSRTYGQYCPISAALDVVGDRWNLLILRELSFGPQRFTDLRHGLAGIAPNLLSDRLRDLESAGVVQRDELPPPAARTVYVLTDEGRTIRPVLAALARFGAGRLPVVHDDDPIRPHAALATAITAFHDPLASTDVDHHYRLVIDDQVFDIRIAHGKLGRPPADSAPDLILTASGATLVRIRQGTVALIDVLSSGQVTAVGTKRVLQQFRRSFEFGA